MSTAQTAASDQRSAAVEARVLRAFESRLESIAAAMVQLSRSDVPGYAAHKDPAFLAAAQAHCQDHVRAFLTVARERRLLVGDELAFVRRQAELRARQGVALDVLLHAYRMGHRAIFQTIVELAGTSAAGLRAALSLTQSTLAHVDLISTTFTEAYLAEERRLVEDTERAARELVELALAGALTPEEAGVRAQALRLAPEAGYAVAVIRADPADPDALARTAEALNGRGAVGPRVHATMRDGELVAIVPTQARDAATLRERLEPAAAAAGGNARAGLSLTSTDLMQLAGAYEEAIAALHAGGPRGVGSLRELSLAEFLARRAGAQAQRLVEPRVAAALRHDHAEGGVLLATLAAYLDSDLNAAEAARRLFVHPNTVHYRLRKLATATGREPRKVQQLVELSLAARVLDLEH